MYPYSVDYSDPNVINGVVNNSSQSRDRYGTDPYDTDPYSANPYSTNTCIRCGKPINSANRAMGYSRYCRDCI